MASRVKDLTVGSFEGIITLVYEDKESNSKVLEKLKSKYFSIQLL